MLVNMVQWRIAISNGCVAPMQKGNAEIKKRWKSLLYLTQFRSV